MKKIVCLFIVLMGFGQSLSYAKTSRSLSEDRCSCRAVPSCVKSIQGTKAYLCSENLFPTEEGIFLEVSNHKDLVALPVLFSDREGCYVPLEVLEKAINSERGPCGIHNQWCKTCGGCGVIYCPM